MTSSILVLFLLEVFFSSQSNQKREEKKVENSFECLFFSKNSIYAKKKIFFPLSLMCMCWDSLLDEVGAGAGVKNLLL